MVKGWWLVGGGCVVGGWLVGGCVDDRLMLGDWWLMGGWWMDGGWALDVARGLWVMVAGG